MIERGRGWGGPAGGPPDLEVAGGDTALAAAAAARPGARIWFRPERSDLARAVGIATPRAPGSTELPIDALRLEGDTLGADVLAVNAVVLGAPPDRLRRHSRLADVAVRVDGRERFRGRATTVVVASGQHLRGLDLVPRGHPGDGRAEVQVYALRGRERTEMRRRLRTGAHVPHPRIRELTGRRIDVRFARAAVLEVDGERRGRATGLVVEVVPRAVSLLV